MMRLKFRAWDIKNEQMCEVAFVNFRAKTGVLSGGKYTRFFDFKEVIIEPWVCEPIDGGQDFYVGDIIEVPGVLDRGDGTYDNALYVLFYDEELLQYMAQCCDDTGSYVCAWEIKHGKVVGNIHDNPEMIENDRVKRNETMNVKEIISNYLKENGCDGLCNVDDFGDDVCGCGVDDLFACKALDACGDIPRCRPAKYNKETGLYELAESEKVWK